MRLASWLGVATLIGCGAAPVVAAPVVAAVADVPSTTPDAPPPPNAVAVQLALMPPLPIDAQLPWLQLDATQRDAIDAYERSLGHGTITASCANGEVRVGPDAHQRSEEPGPEVALTSSACGRPIPSCAVTVGQVLACRAALRDQPCRILGEGLAECDAVRECVDYVRAVHEQYEQFTRRMPLER
jgi:hypothetical protein